MVGPQLQLRDYILLLEDGDIYVADILEGLTKMGYNPGLYSRGKYWRFHIETGGNIWHDGLSIRTAIRECLKKAL